LSSGQVHPTTFGGPGIENVEVSGVTVTGASYFANNVGAALANFGGAAASRARKVQVHHCEFTQATSFAVYCVYTDAFNFHDNYDRISMCNNRFVNCVDDNIALTALGGGANQNQGNPATTASLIQVLYLGASDSKAS
jgi:hypothetical protein